MSAAPRLHDVALAQPLAHHRASRRSPRAKGETGMKKLGMLMAGACALALTQTAMAGQAGPSDPKAVEAALHGGVSSQDQLDWLKQMASAPNHVGSPHDKANAEFMLAK